MTADGPLRFPPLVAVISGELAPGAVTSPRRHAGIDVVCLVLSGGLIHEPSGAAPVALGSESVARFSMGWGAEYRWRSIGDQPARVLTFWLRGRNNRAPCHVARLAPRASRVGELVAVAGAGTPVPMEADLQIKAVVLPVGASLYHDAGARPCYLVSTLGQITIDGASYAPGGGIVDRGGPRWITACQSTEVVIVEAAAPALVDR